MIRFQKVKKSSRPLTKNRIEEPNKFDQTILPFTNSFPQQSNPSNSNHFPNKAFEKIKNPSWP